METPVIYFYSKNPVTLSVKVRFPRGWVTEWYPRSPEGYRNWSIEWPSVEVRPGETPALPVTSKPNHYFAARETDSAPIVAGGQWEKLIFYRGIGDIPVPLHPSFTGDGSLRIRNLGGRPVPLAILFENRDGRIGYRLTGRIEDEVTVRAPELTGSLEQLREELAGDLVEFGLYRREALAMIETWRDSWFEEGMRLFYLVPRAQIDHELPLTIKPEPSSIARVFVGRVEILTPWIAQRLKTASVARDLPALRKAGRFLTPFAEQIRRTTGDSILIPPAADGPSCVQ
jgi:hypothetical protein